MKKKQKKNTLQTSEMPHNSPHLWVYLGEPLGQTTWPSSGLFHPILSPCALLASIAKQPRRRNGSDLHHRWILALVLALCIFKGRKNALLLPHHSCIYVKDSFIKHSERSCSNWCHSNPHSCPQLALLYMVSVLTCTPSP